MPLTESELSELHSKRIVLANRKVVIDQLLHDVAEEWERIKRLEALIDDFKSRNREKNTMTDKDSPGQTSKPTPRPSVEQWLHDNPGWHTVGEIAQATGWAYSTAQNDCYAATMKGKAIRDGVPNRREPKYHAIVDYFGGSRLADQSDIKPAAAEQTKPAAADAAPASP